MCRLGCGARDADELEHYLNCKIVRTVARRVSGGVFASPAWLLGTNNCDSHEKVRAFAVLHATFLTVHSRLADGVRTSPFRTFQRFLRTSFAHSETVRKAFGIIGVKNVNLPNALLAHLSTDTVDSDESDTSSSTSEDSHSKSDN